MFNTLTCYGPLCKRPSEVKGLCDGHYQQVKADKSLSPLQIRTTDPDASEKRCNTCLIVKAMSEFGRRSKRKSGYSGSCKDCNRETRRRWAERNADKVRGLSRAQRRNQRWKKLGVTEDEYYCLWLRQKGRCALCWLTSESALVVDHDHRTGEVRGLLCNGCNLFLGWTRDSPELLDRIVSYVRN